MSQLLLFTAIMVGTHSLCGGLAYILGENQGWKKAYWQNSENP